MAEFCPKCNDLEAENKLLKTENSQMRSVLGIARRALNEVDIESLENMDSLKIVDAERLLIIEALGRTNGHYSLAAKLLGIARSSLFVKVKKYGIWKQKKGLGKKEAEHKIEGLNL
jgi:transcriptional regulator of acetoin/glycerol metabolism